MSLLKAWPRSLSTASACGVAMLLVLAGCSGGGKGPTQPDSNIGALGSSTGSLQGRTLISTESGEMQGVPGGWTWEMSGDPLQVSVTPWRNSQGPQGLLFDLDIANFYAPDTLRVTGVRFDADNNVIVDYTIKHPFAAPDFAKPINAANRADLSFTGRLLFLIDVPSADLPNRRFFGNSVVANTDAVLNPNHFVDPGDLLATSTAGFNATTFPARLVVDEARGGGQGNRIGIPNGGTPTGNYAAATGGWQRGNIGTNRDGWTGYDYLHQGQRASGTVTFSKESVAAGIAKFDTALLIKYTDPRGVPFFQNPNVRMPQQPADIGVFAYRMPNGALDASDVSFSSLTNKVLTIGGTAGSNAPLTVKVRDWDARASETSQTVLSNDTDISKINIGTSGTPVVTLSAPALTATDVTFSAGAQSGLPGAEIQYTGTVTNTLGTAPELSRQSGLVRVVDPENSAPGRNTYTFGVDPVELTGDPARAVEVITYQALFFDIPDTNRAPGCGALAINGSSTIGSGGTFTVNLAGITDADADALDLSFAYSGPTNSSTSSINLTDAARSGEGMFNPFTDVRLASKLQSPVASGNYTLTVTISDGTADPIECELDFAVVANSASDCGTTGINEPGPFPGPANFTLDLSGITDSDSSDLSLLFSYTGPENDISSDLAIATADLPSEATFNPFSDSRLEFPLRRPTTAGDYNLLIEISDGTNSTSCGPYAFTVSGVANQPPDCGTFASQFPKSVAPGGTFTVDLTAVDDPDGDNFIFSFSYIGPGGTSASGNLNLTRAQLAGENAFNPFTDGRIAPTLVTQTTTGDYTLTIVVSDGVDATQCGPYTFTVEGAPNLPPDCGTTGINGSGVIPIDGTFTVDLSGITDPDTADLDISFDYTGPESSASSAATLAVADLGSEDQFDPFADARLTVPLNPPGTAGEYELNVRLDDGDNQVTCGPFPFTVEGVTGPPDCGAGITLSESQFNEGETVDFTIDMSNITDPDSLEVDVTVDYTGPSSSTTSTVTVPFPLPGAINPFTDPGFVTKLTRPTLVGTYTLTVTATDTEDNTTECITTFSISPVGGEVDPVTDIDVVINRTDVTGINAKQINTTDTLTITWAEDDAPEYAVYADLNPTVDREAPEYDPVTYKPNLPEITDELQLIGTTTTNSFTGFSIDPLEGILIAYIVVRARETAGSAASETADSEGAFVGLVADAEALASVDPFWVISANDPGDPIGLFLLNTVPLNGVAWGVDNLNPASLAGFVSINVPTPMDANLDHATLTGNFIGDSMDIPEGQGAVAFTTEDTLATLTWAPVTDPGTPYTSASEFLDWLTGVPTEGNTAHETDLGDQEWLFFQFEGVGSIDGGAIGHAVYTFGNLANTVCPDECPGWDEVGWVMD